MTIFIVGRRAMPKFLIQGSSIAWLFGGVVACLAGSVLARGTHYKTVFHVVASRVPRLRTGTFEQRYLEKVEPGHRRSKRSLTDSSTPWLTAGTFVWLWPR